MTDQNPNGDDSIDPNDINISATAGDEIDGVSSDTDLESESDNVSPGDEDAGVEGHAPNDPNQDIEALQERARDAWMEEFQQTSGDRLTRFVDVRESLAEEFQQKAWKYQDLTTEVQNLTRLIEDCESVISDLEDIQSMDPENAPSVSRFWSDPINVEIEQQHDSLDDLIGDLNDTLKEAEERLNEQSGTANKYAEMCQRLQLACQYAEEKVKEEQQMMQNAGSGMGNGQRRGQGYGQSQGRPQPQAQQRQQNPQSHQPREDDVTPQDRTTNRMGSGHGMSPSAEDIPPREDSE